MKIKELNQEEYPLEILQDLGTQFISPTSKVRKRVIIAKCPICMEGFRTQAPNVKNGRTSKCKSCANKATGKRSTKHGLHGSTHYTRWKSMRNRCNNPNDKHYDVYGGRGITICEEWTEFKGFNDWAISSGYKDGMSIDRIDNNKGYSPENCRWADGFTQAANQQKPRGFTNNYKNVYYIKESGKFRANIRANGILHELGRFESEEDAVKAVNTFIESNNLPHTKSVKEINGQQQQQ